MKVLIVEDEQELSHSICEYLASESFLCEQAFDFDTAIEKIELYDYACIVLDINLPDGNGLELLRFIKQESRMDGIIIVSAKDSVTDKVAGLKYGADDYLTKPFHLSELSARIEAVIRRKFFNNSNLLHYKSLTIDLQSKQVLVGEEAVSLTKKEYDLLLYLISNKNKVVSKSAIAIYLWGDDFDNTNDYDFIYTHIKNLRKKLMGSDSQDYIQSVYGSGYKFS